MQTPVSPANPFSLFSMSVIRRSAKDSVRDMLLKTIAKEQFSSKAVGGDVWCLILWQRWSDSLYFSFIS